MVPSYDTKKGEVVSNAKVAYKTHSKLANFIQCKGGHCMGSSELYFLSARVLFFEQRPNF